MLVRLAIRNATRNGVRTVLTAVTVLLGTALLTVALAWMHGVFGSMLDLATAAAGHVRVVDPDWAKREELMPLYENIADVEPVLATVRETPGVVAAYPRITTGVTVTVGEEIGEVFGLAVGAPDAYYSERLDLEASLVAGRMRSAEGEAVLGRTLAEQAGARVGDRVLLLGQTQDGALSPIEAEVVGIVSAGNALVDQQAFLSLEQLRWLTDIPDGAIEVLVYGEERDDARRIALALGDRLPEHAVEAWSGREPWAGIVAIATVVQGVMQAIIVFITALGVWNTMMMSVLERTGEIGVMRAMGLGRLGAVGLFVVEGLAIATIGGLGGVVLGGIGGYVLETRGIHLGDKVTQNVSAQLPIQSTVYGDLNAEVVITAFLLGLCMALVGSAVPAIRAAAIQPVVAMRARR